MRATGRADGQLDERVLRVSPPSLSGPRGIVRGLTLSNACLSGYADRVRASFTLSFDTELDALPATRAAAIGYRCGDRGTHTSRTIMLSELSQLLGAVTDEVGPDDYAAAVVVDNCLAKRTASNRRLSLQRLKELYALDPRVPLFRVLRDMWVDNETSRPLLALLLALARDPILRATATAVIRLPLGQELVRRPVVEAIAEAVGSRFSDGTLQTVVRNTLSSWTQSGHLRGRSRKFRQRVVATPAATTYALLVAFATGRRGRRLFEAPWVTVLDADSIDLLELADAARSLGLLDLKRSGSMVDVSFPRLTTASDRELMIGPH